MVPVASVYARRSPAKLRRRLVCQRLAYPVTDDWALCPLARVSVARVGRMMAFRIPTHTRCAVAYRLGYSFATSSFRRRFGMSLRGKTEVRRCHHRAGHGTRNPPERGAADRPAAHRQSTLTRFLPRVISSQLGLDSRLRQPPHGRRIGRRRRWCALDQIKSAPVLPSSSIRRATVSLAGD